MVTLDDIDYRILTILGKEPLGRIIDLSKKVGISNKTFTRRLAKLIANNVFLGVSAQICHPALDLDPILVFINTKFKNLDLIEKMCNLHPYARYRIRCLGAVNGLMAMFAMPRRSISLLLELLDELKEKGVILNYNYTVPIGKWIYGENDFSYYDIKRDTWIFDWRNWEKYLESVKSLEALEEYPPSVLHKMDLKDMMILRELTINARKKLKVIAEKCNVPIYHLSRRMDFYIKNGVIEGFRVLIASHASRLFDLFIFRCKCSIKITSKFAKAIKAIPFQFTFIPLSDGFLLWLFLPPTNVSFLGNILQKYCDDVDFAWADYRSSMRYWFYHEPFVDSKWVANRNMLVRGILRKLDLK